MIISHIKDENGQIQATLVATSLTNLGISIRNPKDPINKHLGITIAKNRAELGCEVKIPNRIIEFTWNKGKSPTAQQIFSMLLKDVIGHEILKMRHRALKYFKPEVPETGRIQAIRLSESLPYENAK